MIHLSALDIILSDGYKLNTSWAILWGGFYDTLFRSISEKIIYEKIVAYSFLKITRPINQPIINNSSFNINVRTTNRQWIFFQDHIKIISTY